MLLSTSGVRILMRSRQPLASSSSRRGESSGPERNFFSDRTPMLWAIDHPGKTPSDCRSPATSATGAATVAPDARMRGGCEGRKQKVGLAVSREARKANDLALARHHIPIICLSLGAHAHDDWSFAARTGRRLPPEPGRASGSMPPMAPTSFARSKLRATSAVTTLPSRMTTIRSHVESTSPRICEISTQLTPDLDRAAYMGQAAAPPCARRARTSARRE